MCREIVHVYSTDVSLTSVKQLLHQSHKPRQQKNKGIKKVTLTKNSPQNKKKPSICVPSFVVNMSVLSRCCQCKHDPCGINGRGTLTTTGRWREEWARADSSSHASPPPPRRRTVLSITHDRRPRRLPSLHLIDENGDDRFQSGARVSRAPRAARSRMLLRVICLTSQAVCAKSKLVLRCGLALARNPEH